jgi:hypothetical protein
MDNWEEKVQKILETTVDKNITLLSGKPEWFFYKRLLSWGNGRFFKNY